MVFSVRQLPDFDFMTCFTSGRFDKEEEAIAIANAAEVGLAGRFPDWRPP